MNNNNAEDERRYWLSIEEELAADHRALYSTLKRVQSMDAVEVEAPVQSALWALGVAVLQAAEQVHLCSIPAS